MKKVARLAKTKDTIFPGQTGNDEATGGRVILEREGLTNDLVDLAITNTGGAGEPGERRGVEVEASRANGATSRRRKRRTGCPGKGGNAAAGGGERKSFALASIGLN